MERKKKISRSAWTLAILAAGLISLTACSKLRRMEKQLAPVDRDFVNQVRYIITRQERKIYVSLQPEERPAFRRDFWKRRDPSPDTEINEYREAYFQRIAQANRLFRSEGRAGWLSDRGRVFVLLGEPDRRDVYPTGYSFYEPPVEVWHYGFFPIIFVDRFKQGKYEMMQANAYYLNAIARAQILLNLPGEIATEGKQLDFKLNTEAAGEGKLDIRLVVPYDALVFSRDGDRYKAVILVDASLAESDETVLWSKKKKFSLSVTEKELVDLAKGYKIQFRAMAGKAGAFVLNVRLSNQGEDKVAEKRMKVRVR